MEEQQYHIKQLRLRLQTLLGRKIAKNADLVELESLINNRLNPKNQISYSTLRRFFGFIPSTSPRPKTLLVLSKALGHANFSEFCIKHQTQQVWGLLELFEQLEHSPKLSNKLLPLLQEHSRHPYYLSHFSYFLQQQLKAAHFQLLYKIFDVPALFPESYAEKLRLADILGIVARSINMEQHQTALIKLIYSSKIAEEIFLYLFVDYGSFNQYYGKLIYAIDLKKIKNRDDQLFILLVRNHIAFLQNKKMTALPQVISQDMHPILKGRYHAQQLLMSHQPSQKIAQIFSEARISSTKQEYFFEILSLLIIIKDLDSIAKIEHLYYREILTPRNWAFESKKAFGFIAFSLLAIQRREFESAKNVINLINIQEISNSYRTYIQLLYCIPTYHLSVLTGDQKNASVISRKYKSIATGLGLDFFTIAFLKNYFLE
ncbi:MAG: hypothetical protein MK212_14265 [Saprospiraceae bacterium]|nr:hypothetical protein [Saprospiraceae bacterium]